MVNNEREHPMETPDTQVDQHGDGDVNVTPPEPSEAPSPSEAPAEGNESSEE